MNTTPINFLLTPDSSSARSVRKLLAERAPGLYRLAGTWQELMAQAEAAYLLAQDTDAWSEKLKHVALQQKDAFWASSLEVAPRETFSELDAALHRLLDAVGPDSDWKDLAKIIPEESRLYQRLLDLSQLLETAGGLPGQLQRMACLLACEEKPLRPISVYFSREMMNLTTWQTAVLDKIEGDTPPKDPDLQSILETALAFPDSANLSLKAVHDLYGKEVVPPSKIEGVRVIAARDSLAEAEIAAGLIQSSLTGGCQMKDIGLLLPDDALSLMAVEEVFSRCGLPLSGFRRPTRRRDLGRETLRFFLICMKKPAPIMAIAALLTSPLMLWSLEEGHKMAQAVMNGDVLLKKNAKNSPAALKLMDLLSKGATTPKDLQIQLKRFVGMIAAEADLYDHFRQVHETAVQLQKLLSEMQKLNWEKLLDQTRPVEMNTALPVDYWVEGIPVFHESNFPWCGVNHLFVLGFNDGHYPAGAGSSAVFTEVEWEQIAQAGLPVVTNDLLRKRQRELFETQLSAASKKLTIMFARRDAVGKALEPSTSLVYLSRCLGVEVDALVLDLDRSEDIRKIPDLPLEEKAFPTPLRDLQVADIDVKTDLMKAFSREDGILVPLSPSAADTLMVSPFAWFLGRLDCSPKAWVPDEFGVMTAGTLAHAVFEDLFRAGHPLPTDDEIKKTVPTILRERTLQLAPFLRSPDWRVERYKFEAEVLKAAQQWKKLLASCKAVVVGAEKWLRGQLGDVPLHGQSDLLLQLPSAKLLVVDYKKSSSKKRRERMKKGFDLQAHLYRLMIQTGGLPGLEPIPDDIGIVYYLLNDTTALADSPVDADGSVPGWEELTSDISSQAMERLTLQLAQVRKGLVQLNTTDDEKWWDKNAGVPIYALDNSPLLRLFMHNREVPL